MKLETFRTLYKPPFTILQLIENIDNNSDIVEYIINNLIDDINTPVNGKRAIQFAGSNRVIQILLNAGAKPLSELQLENQITQNQRRYSVARNFLNTNPEIKHTLRQLPHVSDDVMYHIVGMLTQTNHLDTNIPTIYRRDSVDLIPDFPKPKFERQYQYKNNEFF